MSWRFLIVPHDGPIDPSLIACADVIIRPLDTREQIAAHARHYAYWQPLRVFVAPGEEASPVVRMLQALWEKEAPGMAWSLETLPALSLTKRKEASRANLCVSL